MLPSLLAAWTGIFPTVGVPGPRVGWSDDAIALGVRYDLSDEASSYGLAALRTWEWFQGRGGLGVMTWLGVGLDARLVTLDHEDVDAVLVGAPARLGLAGDAGGFSLEAAGGVWLGDETVVVLAGGAFWSALFVDVGYTVQLPLGDAPEGLATHLFSVRIQVPVHRWNRSGP